jgi:hypothetical protein
VEARGKQNQKNATKFMKVKGGVLCIYKEKEKWEREE